MHATRSLVAAMVATLLLLSPAAIGGTNARRLTRLDPAELVALARSNAPVAGIQFDDGHISHYTVATPVLQAHGMPGSFGIVTGNTGVNPSAMTDAMILEMYASLGYDFQDHTWNHDAALWGNAANGATWSQHIAWSQEVFQRIGFPGPMRAWNQPGGPGEGFSAALRDTLIANGYTYAAGRVGLNNYQFRNMHYGSIDDPFSYGRWVYSWKYNAPATGWNWRAETGAVITRYADAIAQGGFPIVVFHVVDTDAAAGLDSLCTWLSTHGVTVLGMDDLVALAQLDRSHRHGVNIAPSLHVDRNGDGRPDGFDQYATIDMAGNAGNGAGSILCGPPPGRLVVSATIRAPLQTGATDDFAMVYQRQVIDPVTFAYSTTDEMRGHTLALGQSLSFSDTLEIGERVDRVKFWVQAVNTQPFVIESLSAVPLSEPTGVRERTPHAALAVAVSPNPGGGTVNIWFRVAGPSRARVAVYGVDGRLVARLTDAEADGVVTVPWRTDRVPAGVYFARVQVGTAVATRKIVVVR
jgi:peptidoglycan/xylan/chitin deacetylase (PgdA/CDA1 family)